MTVDKLRTAEEARREAEERRQVKAVQDGCAKVTAALALTPLVAFVVMLAVGALHGVVPAVAPVGYGTTVLLVLGLDAAALITKKFRK
ncbi:hypothetical protein [Streptomyces longwoodensis]|uniref:hypothetical protein n=1 Tax=Streptomyces longwoodensis TaxID=68231 RepID=UPI0033D02321